MHFKLRSDMNILKVDIATSIPREILCGHVSSNTDLTQGLQISLIHTMTKMALKRHQETIQTVDDPDH